MAAALWHLGLGIPHVNPKQFLTNAPVEELVAICPYSPCMITLSAPGPILIIKAPILQKPAEPLVPGLHSIPRERRSLGIT